jgi:hypothetical protein
MNKSIKIFYNSDFDSFIQLYYDIELQDNIHVIHCSIATTDRKAIPYWLHPRKFDFRSLCIDGSYSPLFNGNENINNRASIMFIEKAYEAIMENEKLTILE